jgi:RNA polymerase sigma factor (sigma-70 family)
MRTTVLFFIFYQGITMIYALQTYFSSSQWKKARFILDHPGTTDAMKQEIQLYIFEAYKEWSKYYGVKKYKKRIHAGQIQKGDIEIYALIGLWKAIDHYDPLYPFYTYAKQCIHWSLYKGIRQMAPISKISYHKSMRMPYAPSTTLLFDEYKEIAQICDTIESFEKDLTLEPSMNASTKRMFQYKYNNQMQKIRSNKEVAELMCCSEETVRKRLATESLAMESLAKKPFQ